MGPLHFIMEKNMSYHDPDRQKIRDIRAKHYEKLAKAKEEPKAKADKKAEPKTEPKAKADK